MNEHLIRNKNSWLNGIIFVVLLSYISFLPYSVFYLFKFTKNPSHYYQSLTKGFLSGQLSMSVKPSQQLLKLKDPYDPIQNKKYRLHDASLYKEKYYMYFGVFPVLGFFMPFKLLTGYYPSNALAVFLFLSIGFLALFSILIKIRERYFSCLSDRSLIIPGLLLGVATTAPYLLGRPSFYEIAIGAAFCCMSIALFSLYEFFHSINTKNTLLFSLFLSLTVSCRPNFVFICFFVIAGIFIYLIKNAEKKFLLKLIIALILPPLIIGSALGLYNYLRFDSIFEFGQRYQLAGVKNPIIHFNLAEIYEHAKIGLFMYFVHPYFFKPIISIPKAYSLEPTAGILLSTPLVLFSFLLPMQLIYLFKQKKQVLRPLLYFLSYMLSIPIIIILFLISLPFVNHRYEMDFIPYLIFLSIISLWLIQISHQNTKWHNTINILYVSTALISLFTGVILKIYF